MKQISIVKELCINWLLISMISNFKLLLHGSLLVIILDEVFTVNKSWIVFNFSSFHSSFKVVDSF